MSARRALLMLLASGCAVFPLSEAGAQVAQDDYLRGWRDGHNEWDRLMGSIGVD